jgi:hypothetical protein
MAITNHERIRTAFQFTMFGQEPEVWERLSHWALLFATDNSKLTRSR